jgi:hypothetical protein
LRYDRFGAALYSLLNYPIFGQKGGILVGVQIVIRGGDISEKGLAKNPDEYTTQDVLTDLSVYVGEVKNMRYEGEAWDVAQGYPGNTITASKKSNFDEAGAKFKKDALGDQPNHYLLSGITIQDAVDIWKKQGTRYER